MTAAAPTGCSLTVNHPVQLNGGECVEVTAFTSDRACPVGFNTTRELRFSITAQTPGRSLRWRRSPNNSDVLDPESGALASAGSTDVVVSDLVIGEWIDVQVVEGEVVLMSFRLRHR